MMREVMRLAALAAACAIAGPLYAVAYNGRGTAWEDKGDLDRALADLSEAIRLDPRHADSYINRGVVWRTKKELDRAITDFNESIRVSRSALGYYNRGAAYEVMRDYSRAMQDYDEALRIQPAYPLAEKARAALLQKMK